MLKVYRRGAPLTVSGDQLKVGDKMPEFSVVTKDLEAWKLSDVKGTKIISVVPSLDTGTCQVQTMKFNAEASKLSNTSIFTISLDLPFAQNRWCGAEGVDKHTVLSDYQNRDFATKTNLLIDELKLLTRAVFVLDSDNVIQYVEYILEISEEPNYQAALDALAKL